MGQMKSSKTAAVGAVSPQAWGRRARLPHTALAQLLETEIQSGRYKVGDRLPTELELQQKYGVSRYCVREALQQLKDAGMVAARAGIGHAVTASQPVEPLRYMRSAITLPELVQSANTRLQLLHTRHVRVDADLAARTGFPPGLDVIEVRALRIKLALAMPTAILTIYLQAGHAMVIDNIEGQPDAFHVMIERLCDVTIQEVRQRILAVNAKAADASALQATKGQASLEITRQFLDSAGQVIFASIGVYPSDRFSHDTSFQVVR
ncbi:GntR family transcriptional regulator [Bordetella petrii]|nr:GntR family transcriptional regulator [Bordetella petrii]